MSIRDEFFGDKKFYRQVIALAVPVIIQTGITNFVSLLDNIMVGRLGTEQMSGVSIVNQFVFIFNLLIFGAISGAGIFTVQYHGNKNTEGVRHTFRFKVLINVFASIIAVIALTMFDDNLISMFLFENEAQGDLALTMAQGKEYLKIMLVGLLPYALSQVYASTLRETEHTVAPMTASLIAVGTNFVLNYVLIFGKFGAPAMGVGGAALATVISRFVELAALVIWTHTNSVKCPFIKGAFRSFAIPRDLALKMVIKGLPLLANEFLWSLSMTLRNQCYATRGIEVVAAQNISSTIFNLFSVVYMSFGTVISIIIGGLLGAGRLEDAKATSKKLLTCSVLCGLLLGGLLAICSGLFPQIYNTEDNVRHLAAYMMIVSGCLMPIFAFAHGSYFTIRSGGKVGITFVMDSGFMWLIVIPISFVLSRFTGMNIFFLYAICQSSEILKVIFSLCLLKKGTWVQRLVEDKK